MWQNQLASKDMHDYLNLVCLLPALVLGAVIGCGSGFCDVDHLPNLLCWPVEVSHDLPQCPYVPHCPQIASRLLCGTRFVLFAEKQAWGDFGRGPHLPQGLVHLSLPHLSLSASLGREINGLPDLTRLDCQSSGFFPARELVGLKVQ